MAIVIVMPAYQAEKTISSVFPRIPQSVLDKVEHIAIVNDGSTDNLVAVVDELKKNYPQITVLTHEVNKGYGAAQKTGYNFAMEQNADIAVLLHSDGQYAPEKLPELLEPLEKGEADVVMGSRMLAGGALKGGMPYHKYLGNKFLTTIENLAYGMNVSEYHTGYMLYSKKALTKIPYNKLSDTFHFDGEMIMMSGKKKLRIKEFPIPTHYGEEESHLNPITYGLTVLKIVFKSLKGDYDKL